MRITTKTVLGLLVLGVSGWMLTAQDAGNATPSDQGPPPNEGPGGPGGPGHHRPPPPPLIAALDANHDGVIDETEIANASAALKTLDKNGDGKLTMDELMPPRPPRGERHGRPPGPPPGAENGQAAPKDR
jgi:EF hand domain-containing protein